MACLQLVEPAARVDHRRPIRLPGRLLASRVDLASRTPVAVTGFRASLPVGVFRCHAGDAAGRDQALPVRHLGRPAVPHGVPDPAHRHRRPARHDLLRSAAVLSAGLVLDRRPTRGTDRHARVGDVQAVGDHLHHDRRGAGFRVVGQHDSLRVRADRVDRHRCRRRWPTHPPSPTPRSSPCCCRRCSCSRGRACGGARTRGAQQNHSEAAVGPRSSASASSSVSPRCSTRCCWLTPRSR